MPGQGELGTEAAINNTRRLSHVFAGCRRIPLSSESGYFQRSSSSLSAGELLNSSSAPLPLYRVCVFLLSYLAGDRLFPSCRLCRRESSGLAYHLLLSFAPRLPVGEEKAPEMEQSYRTTISIYKVSASAAGCSCLPKGGTLLGGEELVF